MIRSEMSWGRGVAIMVAVGVGLGVLYNAAGLMSRPPRGIPWLAAKGGVASLDTLATPPPGAGIAAAQEPAQPAVQAAPPRETAGPAPGDPAVAEAQHGVEKAERAGGARSAGSVQASDKKTHPAPASAPTHASTASTAPEKPASTGTTQSTTSSTSRTTQPATTAPEKAAAPLPFIPESDQPVRVKLATAKVFFDAGAALFIDARDASEYEEGHIPGAMRMTRDEALGDPDRVKALPVQGRPIVAYCDGGECEASLELAQALVGAGYRKVLVYAGGFPEWVAAGYPVERAGAAK